jgi:NAD(P)H-flavin reductase
VTATSKDPRWRRPAPDALIEVRLIAIRYLARDTSLLELKASTGAAARLRARRAYRHLPMGWCALLAHPRRAEPALRGRHQRDPASRGGRAHHDELRVGTILTIGGPRNNFRLHEDATHIVLIAGGIGITPIWCMVQRLNALGRAWQLHYACRSRDDMAFRQELEALPQATLHFDDESGGFLDVAAIVAAAPKDAHLYCWGRRRCCRC